MIEYARDAVEVGQWYAVDFEVYERTDFEPCPDGDHPMCHDRLICEVSDIHIGDPFAVARQIAQAHNAQEEHDRGA